MRHDSAGFTITDTIAPDERAENDVNSRCEVVFKCINPISRAFAIVRIRLIRIGPMQAALKNRAERRQISYRRDALHLIGPTCARRCRCAPSIGRTLLLISGHLARFTGNVARLTITRMAGPGQVTLPALKASG